MSKKYEKVNNFFDFPELVQKFRGIRSNYDYPCKSWSVLLDQWFILETFVENVKTKNGIRTLVIISELSDPEDPYSKPTGMHYRVFSSSKRINEVLSNLRITGDELRMLPMTFRVISVTFESKKSGKKMTRYEFDLGLGK